MKKKLFYPLLMMLFCGTLFGQQKIASWSMDFYYSPQYVQYLGNGILKNTTLVNPTYSYTIGLGFNKRLNKKMAVNIGFAFAGTSNESTGGLRWGSSHDGNGEYVAPDPDNTIYAFKEFSYYFQMPIGIRYYWSQSTWKFYVQPGFDLEYLQGKRNAYLRKDEQGKSLVIAQNSVDVLQQYSVLAALRMGLEKSLNARFSFFLEPEYSISLVNISSLISAGAAKRSNLGIRIGARLALKP